MVNLLPQGCADLRSIGHCHQGSGKRLCLLGYPVKEEQKDESCLAGVNGHCGLKRF